MPYKEPLKSEFTYIEFINEVNMQEEVLITVNTHIQTVLLNCEASCLQLQLQTGFPLRANMELRQMCSTYSKPIAQWL